MMIKRLSYLLGLCVGGVALVLAQAQAAIEIPEIKVGKPPFVETTSPSVKVAGGKIMGVMLGNPETHAGNILTVTGLTPIDKTVCVRIEHVSGTYVARFKRAVQFSSPTVRFVLPSSDIPKLNAPASALAVIARASSKSDCTDSDPVLPAAWGKGPILNGFILINDHQANSVRAAVTGSRLVPCEPLANSLTNRTALTAFNQTCKIPLIGTCGESSEITIQLFDGFDQSTIRSRFRVAC